MSKQAEKEELRNIETNCIGYAKEMVGQWPTVGYAPYSLFLINFRLVR